MSNASLNTQTPQRFSNEWETKQVSEFGNVVTGATPSTKVNAFWNGPYPWITPTDIPSERDMTVSERMITQEGLNAIRTLPSNTVLITCIASIGKNAILRTPGSCNQQINAVIPNSAHNAEFLYYLFEHNSDFLLANAGITATNIVSKSTFSILVFEVPPLPEQRAIAEMLSDVDGLLNALEALIAKKRAIKQATMQQLLTGRTRLPGFSGAWEMKRLGKIADCLDNVRVPLNETQRATMPGPYPYCGANGVLDYVNDYVLDDDVILIAEDGGHFDEFLSRPIAYRMRGKIWVNNHAHILQAKSDYDQGFLYYSLVHKNILPYLSGGTRAKLNKFEMYKIEINVPDDIDEQRAIASVLSDIDAEIAALEQRWDKTRAIKQGMMQQLLTGRVRLSESRICADDAD